MEGFIDRLAGKCINQMKWAHQMKTALTHLVFNKRHILLGEAEWSQVYTGLESDSLCSDPVTTYFQKNKYLSPSLLLCKREIIIIVYSSRLWEVKELMLIYGNTSNWAECTVSSIQIRYELMERKFR